MHLCNRLQSQTQICVFCTQRPLLFFKFFLILVIYGKQINPMPLKIYTHPFSFVLFVLFKIELI
jgi:hypothetical protein